MEKHLGEKFDTALWRNVEMEKDDSKGITVLRLIAQSYA